MIDEIVLFSTQITKEEEVLMDQLENLLKERKKTIEERKELYETKKTLQLETEKNVIFVCFSSHNYSSHTLILFVLTRTL
jgi:single-stranded DNA-specific DHH superfamily exonuclease